MKTELGTYVNVQIAIHGHSVRINQGNMMASNGQSKVPVTGLKDVEMELLPDREFQIAVLQKLSDFKK